jgi:hypothetical protein
MRRSSYLSMATLVAVLAFSSCKKSATPAPAKTTDSDAVMSFTINGSTNIGYTDCEEKFTTEVGVKHTLITGVNLTDGKPGADSFVLDIAVDPATITAGQAFPVASTAAEANAATLIYATDATDTFVTQPANAQGSVTFSAASTTGFTGTFSGKLFAKSDVTGTTVVYTITNGAFTAKYNAPPAP